MTEYKVNVQYSESLLREAVRTFVFRQLFRTIGWIWSAGALLIISMLAYALWIGDRSWFLGMMLAFATILILFPLFIWQAHLNNTVGKFRELEKPEAEFVLRDSDFTATSSLGSATIPWSTVIEIWEGPKFWLLLLARNSFVTLPVNSCSENELAFIRSKASFENNANKRVTD